MYVAYNSINALKYFKSLFKFEDMEFDSEIYLLESPSNAREKMGREVDPWDEKQTNFVCHSFPKSFISEG